MAATIAPSVAAINSTDQRLDATLARAAHMWDDRAQWLTKEAADALDSGRITDTVHEALTTIAETARATADRLMAEAAFGCR